MVILNGVEFDYREGMSLAGLVEDYNISHRKLAFDGFVVIINDTPITSSEAQERTLDDNDQILIVPFLDGG